MASEAAFLKSLFADLDSSVFSSPPSSPQKPLSQPNPPPRQPPRKINPIQKTARVVNQPALPKPFWSNVPSGSRPSSSTPSTSSTSTTALKSRPKHSPAEPLVEQNGPRKGAAATPSKVRRIARVDIRVGGKENKAKVVDIKGKGKAEDVDMDALCEGLDWDEPMMLSQEDKPIVVRVPGTLKPSSVKNYVTQGDPFTRCKVVKVVEDFQNHKASKTLTVELKSREGTCDVLLLDDWIMTPVEPGDNVNLIGPFDPTSTPSLEVSRSQNFIILHPDILVSSTKIADSTQCQRKALLQELVRTTGASTPSLTYGNMLHELMQTCLVEEKWEDEWLGESIKKIVGREVGGLWGMEVAVDQAKEVMREKSEVFKEFSTKFLGSSPGPAAYLSDQRAPTKTLPRLSISKTFSVEEDIWSPKYGLKGKIDVSVSGRIADGPIAGAEGVMPFEIKTGKSMGGNEHRAQTMLYTLLMSDRYDQEITQGLLYYSQTNEVIRVKAARNEIRGLLIARNEFGTYLHRRMTLSMTIPNLDSGDEDYSTHLTGKDLISKGEGEIAEGRRLLPPPIDDARSCKWCYVSDACMLFRKAVEGEDFISMNPEDPLQIAFEDKTGDLTPVHTEFFKKWEKLISLEEQELVRFKKEIWTLGAEERMKLGRCMARMAVDTSFIAPPVPSAGAKIHAFTYRLTHANLASQSSAHRSLLGGNILVNDPVVVSLTYPSTVLSISRGFVVDISSTHITLGLDHSLTAFPQATGQESELVFRIDKDELAAGMGRIRDNLIQLFVPTGDKTRRRLVVDLEPPRFSTAPPPSLLPSSLNPDQVSAVQKVLSAKDYALILGMPGTGKTTTIAEVLKALVAQGKSVLLTAYTHSAVDTILEKVKDVAGLGILRLGNRDKILPSLHRFTLDPENPAETLEQMDQQLLAPMIVATTCLSINDPIFTRRRFDVCIVDEASQVTLPTCLGPLRFANTFVLVGDHNQLPPLVRNRDARMLGLDTSLFKLLSTAHPSSVVYLSHQYRMNEDIMLLSNKLVYEDRLTAGSVEVRKQTLKIPKIEGLREICSGHSKCWISDVLDPDRKVVFIDTDLLPARERKIGPLVDNPIEATLVCQLTEALIKCGVAEHDIGIISPYRQQIKVLSRKLGRYAGVEILTADRSQGRDKDCIIMSMIRSNSDGHVGDLLKDWRRINVCLTRAKSKLIVFGSRSTLANAEILRKFIDVVSEKKWIYPLPFDSHLEHGEVSTMSQRKRPSEDLIAGEGKAVRKGPEGLVLQRPLVRDIVNSL